jgi:hypothetical protein
MYVASVMRRPIASFYRGLLRARELWVNAKGRWKRSIGGRDQNGQMATPLDGAVVF